MCLCVFVCVRAHMLPRVCSQERDNIVSAGEVSLNLRVLLGIFTLTQVTHGSQDVGDTGFDTHNTQAERSNKQATPQFYIRATFST